MKVAVYLRNLSKGIVKKNKNNKKITTTELTFIFLFVFCTRVYLKTFE